MLWPVERRSRAATTHGALGACMLAAVLLASSEGGRVQGRSAPAVRLPAMVRQLRLTLRGGDGMDLSAEEAAALLDSGTEPAVLVQTLGDYRQSEQVQLQGCRRIAAALTAVASNQTAKESLLSSFSEAGAAVALVESLRWHTAEGKAGADLAAAMCESLGALLAGPPNHAPPGDEWWRNDASCSSAMRLASARAGALHLALDVVRAHADAVVLQGARDAQGALLVQRVGPAQGEEPDLQLPVPVEMRQLAPTNFVVAGVSNILLPHPEQVKRGHSRYERFRLESEEVGRRWNASQAVAIRST